MTAPPPSDLISLVEAARRLDVSRWTARRMVARGELPAVRVGRLIKVRASDAEAAAQPIVPPAGGLAGGASLYLPAPRIEAGTKRPDTP